MNIALTKAEEFLFPTGVLDIAISGDEKQVFVACVDGAYRATNNGKQQQRIVQHDSWVSGVGLLTADDQLVTAGYDGQIRFSSLTAQPREQVVRAHAFWSWKMALSPDRQRVASVSGQYLAGSEDYQPSPAQEPTVKVYRCVDGELLAEFGMLPSVQAVAFHPDGVHVAAANLMGDIAVWNVDTHDQVAAWRTPDFTSWGIIKSHCFIGGIHGLAFAHDGESIYAVGMGDMRDPMAGNGRQLWQCFRWRANPPEKIGEIVKGQAGEGLMEAIAMHPSENWFVMAGRLRGGDWNAAIFSTEDGNRLAHVNSEIRVTSAAFSPDGRKLYLAGMKNQPGPKDGRWPSWGVVQRYNL